MNDLSNYFRASMKHYEPFMSFEDNKAIHARVARDPVPELEPMQLESLAKANTYFLLIRGGLDLAI